MGYFDFSGFANNFPNSYLGKFLSDKVEYRLSEDKSKSIVYVDISCIQLRLKVFHNCVVVLFKCCPIFVLAVTSIKVMMSEFLCPSGIFVNTYFNRDPNVKVCNLIREFIEGATFNVTGKFWVTPNLPLPNSVYKAEQVVSDFDTLINFGCCSLDKYIDISSNVSFNTLHLRGSVKAATTINLSGKANIAVTRFDVGLPVTVTGAKVVIIRDGITINDVIGIAVDDLMNVSYHIKNTVVVNSVLIDYQRKLVFGNVLQLSIINEVLAKHIPELNAGNFKLIVTA
jgi:hypothetical protein